MPKWQNSILLQINESTSFLRGAFFWFLPQGNKDTKMHKVIENCFQILELNIIISQDYDHFIC